ncbi:MAG: substrate-binding domain-containing protein [Deltaproteobacteria bacterium]|nr:substrate-binding domain-containing protein [Deltaproteobacteria bacterium]
MLLPFGGPLLCWMFLALSIRESFLLAPFIILSILPGWLWASKAPLPETLFARMMPLILPLLLPPLAYVPDALSGEPFIPGFFLSIILLLAGIPYVCFCLVFLIRSELRRRSTAKARGAARLLGFILVCLGLAATLHAVATRDLVRRGTEASVEHGVDTSHYRPFREGNRLARPASPASLRIEAEHPRLDGAIAALPVYAAFAQAVYAGLDAAEAEDIVACTNTVRAYARLADGKTDIFFGAAPSREQRGYAAAKGLKLNETPIGREAFVFFVHKDNPVRSLTREQVRAVYSGRVRNWKEFGGPDEAILPFQRPEGSGSQTALLRIMEGETLIRPLREEQATGMGDIIIRVATYQNRKNALGYTFRWYATALFSSPDIRLLAIDGVEPTPENIRNGAYPFIEHLLAVTAGPPGAESKSLLDWIIGPEGQSLLERVGYVPLP